MIETETKEILSRLEKIENLLFKKETVKEWYNIKEAAEYLNISVSTCRRLVDRGLIKKSLGIGKIQIPRDSLINYKKLTLN